MNLNLFWIIDIIIKKMLAGIIPFKMMLIPWYIKILLNKASFAPKEDKIPIICTLSKIRVKIEMVTLIIVINTIRTMITIMLKSKIETQLNMFSYFVVIDLTDKLFFSIDRNSLIELSISNKIGLNVEIRNSKRNKGKIS